MLPRRLLSDALEEAANRLDANFGSKIEQRERRLRAALAASLAHRPSVDEVRTSPEWRPEMALWPWSNDGKSKLGGFDLAVRFHGEAGYSLVGELKWTHYGFVNALDEAIWDAFKLAHAVETLPEVTHGVLVYFAPVKAWEKPARFAQLFDDALTSTRELIADHESIWRWCLRYGSSARPTKLPPYLQTGPVARAGAFVDGDAWELRAATVAPNGQPWVDVDADGMPVPAGLGEPTIVDWPHPAPGPGMEPDGLAEEPATPTGEPVELPTEDLVLDQIPGPAATWNEITLFAARFDGYARYGNRSLGELANRSVTYWEKKGVIDERLSLDDLRGCLFFEYRRYRHFGHSPGTDSTPYLRAVVEAIRENVAILRS